MKKIDFIQLKAGDKLVLRKTIGLGPRCVDDEGFRWQSSAYGPHAFLPGEIVEFLEFYRPLKDCDSSHGICYARRTMPDGENQTQVLPRKLIKRKLP